MTIVFDLDSIKKSDDIKSYLMFLCVSGYGMYSNGTTTFANAATVGPGYKPINPPIVFHFEKS